MSDLLFYLSCYLVSNRYQGVEKEQSLFSILKRSP